MKRSCELCRAVASLYCEADSAFLCKSCDATVHGANFLVARHVRRITCAECGSVDAACSISGAGPLPILCVCISCDTVGSDPSPSSSSSSPSCISRDESTAAAAVPVAVLRRSPDRRRRGKADARANLVLESWIRSLGLRSGPRCARVASRVLAACSGMTAVLPLRVCLAAAVWFAVNRTDGESGRGGRTCDGLLRSLETCSNIPAKLILVAESRLSRFARRHRVEEEGSAECS